MRLAIVGLSHDHVFWLMHREPGQGDIEIVAVFEPDEELAKDRMRVAGIEREELSLEGVTQQELAEPADLASPLCLHLESNDRQRLAADDTILRRVIRCWPALPDRTRRKIDAIVVDAVLNGGYR